MTRLLAALVILCSLVAVVLSTVEIRSDAAAIFGPGGAELDALETPAGRELIVALEGDAAARNRAARVIVVELENDPLIGAVRSGPVEPSEDFLDWLWQHRFQIAAPDIDTEAMTARLSDARDALTSAEGMVIGDRLLRDPTGSYAQVIEKLTAQADRLQSVDGIWQAKDDSAALVFVTLADTAFETENVAQLAQRIRGSAAEANVTPHLLGPRIIAAEISAETARSSSIAAGLASLLLIAWLLFSLGSIKAFALCLLPLALGFAAATVAVQFLFGSVHVIALGFGGALTGLALDYPLHMIGHAGEKRAARLVLIGATTTAVGFLAMLGSGVPALMQTGVFIASGLIVAAFAARVVAPAQPPNLKTPPLSRLRWTLPFRPWIEGVLALGGLAIVLAATPPASQALFAPPEHITASIDRMQGMIDLPSGRHAIRVEGQDLSSLLATEAALVPVLDNAIGSGVITDYAMPGAMFSAKTVKTPPADTFDSNARAALDRLGMAPDFASVQAAEYRAALDAPPISLEELQRFPETQPLASLLTLTDDGIAETVRLTGLNDPAALRSLLTDTDSKLVDLAAPIENGLVALRHQVILWLGIGALAAFACLLAGLRGLRVASSIALTTAAALGLTVGVLTLLSGSPGIFQIVALTLVVGIGVDYGLFLRTATDAKAREAAVRSVALCAGSTLIAFAVMAFSPVKLLHEIGLTVSLGVIAMLVLNLAQPRPAKTE